LSFRGSLPQYIGLINDIIALEGKYFKVKIKI
jgi:hypothetical protein